MAPDLMGHGDSDKLDDTGPGSYRFLEHREHLDRLDLGDRITFVVHDWSSALGFDWANRHRDRVVGIVYMEAIVRPVTGDTGPKPPPPSSNFPPMAGEDLMIDKNLFVEAVLPASIQGQLSQAEHDEYRRPFTNPADRGPTLTWPREIPIEGEPRDVVEIVRAYADWLSISQLPKLLSMPSPVPS